MTKLLRIAYIKDHSIEEIVDSHVKYVTKPTIELDFIEEDDETKRFPSMKFVERIVEDNQNPVPRAFTLYTKYEFLIHTIISRCRARDGECTLDYDYFRNLLGKQYGNMLHNLQLMQIINISSVFEIGKSSRIISLLDWEIGFKTVHNNVKLIAYSEKLKKHIKELKIKNKKEQIEILGRQLYYDYVSNLSKIELTKKDEVIEFLKNSPFSSTKQLNCYYDRIENYEIRKDYISSIDYRGRIYHVLTNCPRVLRRFFNLKLDCDIANSQPLLFCNFLIEKYCIKHDIIKELSLIDIDLFNNKDNKDYYKGQLLRRQLKDNGLQLPKCADLPTDILLYIYACMKGIFWDNFVSIFDTLERAEVKENLFREVFYSYSTTMRHKEFGKIFAQIYPNVWKVIRSMKKEETKLWDAITKVESKLFHSILKQCYKRGWAVTSIHDAILVLDVPENEGFNVDDLKNIILKEYGKIGLFPTLHVDYFNEEKDEMMELMEEFSKPL